MSPIEKIEKLLIHDGRPSRELIDYKIDAKVDEMIKEYLNGESAENLSALLAAKKEITLDNNELVIQIHKKDFNWLLSEVKSSLLRYGGYLILCPEWDMDMQLEDSRSTDLPIVDAGFYLTLFISKEHKMAVLEKRALEQNLSNKISVKKSRANKL